MSRADLVVPGGEPAFAVGFSQGILTSVEEIDINSGVTPGWELLDRGSGNEGDKRFLLVGTVDERTIRSGDSVKIGLTGVQARPGGGSHGTVVALRYRDLRLAGAGGSLSGIAAHHFAIVQSYPPTLMMPSNAITNPVVVDGGGLMTSAGSLTLRMRANPELARPGAGNFALNVPRRATVWVSSDGASLQITGLTVVNEPPDVNLERVLTMPTFALIQETARYIDTYRNAASDEGSHDEPGSVWDRYRNGNGLAGKLDFPLDATGRYQGMWATVAQKLFDLGDLYLADLEVRQFTDDRVRTFLIGARDASSYGWPTLPNEQLADGDVAASAPSAVDLSAPDAACVLQLTLHNSGPARIVTLRVRCDGFELAGRTMSDVTVTVPILVGAFFDGTWNLAGKVRDATGFLVPPGTVVAFAGADVPDGWLLCDGQIIDESTNPDLFAALKRDTVPNLCGRFPEGVDAAHALLEPGGLASVQLSDAEVPEHGHVLHDDGHRHPASVFQPVRRQGDEGDVMTENMAAPDWLDALSYGASSGSATTGLWLDTAGHSVAHENRPPYLPLNYIIKY